MAQDRLTFCIFSFNRGRFLENCVRSIEHALPRPEIVIFDDGSDDPETRDYLASIQSRHRVLKPEMHGGGKHGGLYGNMQSALERLRDSELLCYLQDDSQLIRALHEAEVDRFHSLLAGEDGPAFLHPCFIRGIDLTRRPLRMRPAGEASLFFRNDAGQSAGVHYSDLCLFRPARLLASGWRFRESEPENERQARDLFGPMAYLKAPFAMWLPAVGAYRGKRKTWALRIAEKRNGCGYHPYKVWSMEETRRFLDRPGDEPPVAEDWLDCKEATPVKPWTYNPLSGAPLLKQLNNVEVFLRGFGSRSR